MASVFLSYDHEDSDRAAPLAAALEANGHSVWWDRHIHGGAEYNSAIETAVETAEAVIVLWSAKSVRSAWVRDEAGEGRDRGRLVPVLIESVKPPMGFRQYQTIDLAAWNGGKRIPQLPDLLRAIDKVSGTASPGAVAPQPAAKPEPAVRTGEPILSRRALIGTGAAAAVATAGGGIWWATQRPEDPRFAALMEQGNDAVGNWSGDEKALQAVEEAVAIRPGSAAAWGLLALLRSIAAQYAEPKDVPGIVAKAEKEARRALALADQEPNALLAMFELQGSSLDWFARDRKLREILALDPDNIGALSEFVLLTQATGMCRESWELNERALAIAPLNIDFLARRALKLWILGRASQADKVIDQARALYPDQRWVWWVRFYLYAMTGRPAAALAMLDASPATNAAPGWASMWRTILPAIEHPSPATLARARSECIAGAKQSPLLASQAAPALAHLRELDAAFEVANGLLLSRGAVVPQGQSSVDNGGSDAAWKVSTQWMFTPAASPMFADPRFLDLCDGIGLVDYWRRRAIKPDFQRA